MKTVLGLALISTCAFAVPALAHSICQYQSDEAHCSEYPECAWEANADGLGYCVYEKNIIHQGSGGILRRANALVHGNLLAAKREGKDVVNAEYIWIASSELM